MLTQVEGLLGEFTNSDAFKVCTRGLDVGLEALRNMSARDCDMPC